MKLSLILEAVDRMTAPARKAAGGIRSIGDAANPAARSIGGMDRQITRVSANTIKWTRLALRSADAVDRVADRARALARAGALSVKWVGLKSLELSARGASKALDVALVKAKALAGWALRWGSVGAAAGFALVTKGVISTGATFEQFQAQLEGTEGSAAKARSALDWVAKFAADTPYQIGEVTDAFVRARGVGINPFTGAMTSLGDAAAGSRKTLMEAVEAIADAQSGGGFERLKEFNINSSVKGDKVTFSYINRAGKEAQRTVAKSALAVQKAVLEIFDEKYAGGMLRQSRTLAGIWSNLQDKVAGFQLKIASAGFYDRLKRSLQDLLDWANKLEKDGTLDRWAKRISASLSEMVDKGVEFAKSVPWSEAADGLFAVAKFAAQAAAAIGRAANALSKFRYESARRFLDGQLNGWFTSDAERGRIRQQIDDLDREFGKKKSVPHYKGPELRSGVRGERTGQLDTQGWVRSLSQRPALAAPVARPSSRAPLKPATPPKGEISLRVTADQGLKVRPTKVAATGMDMSVQTGRAMGTIA